MSLLLDALKKTEQVQRGTPAEVTANLAPSAMRSAGQNLFAAKAIRPYSRGRFGIIPLALIGGLLLAAGGGYYVWQALTPASSLARPAPAQTAPAIRTAPAIQAVPVIEPAPVTPSAPAAEIPSPAPVVAEKKLPIHSRMPRTHAPQPAPGVQIKSNQSDEINPTLLAAYQAYRSGDFGTAWQLYRNVLQQDTQNRDALLGMAAIAHHQGQDAVAAQYYTRVLTIDPRDPAAQAGMSGLSNGDMATRESHLKLQLSHRPDAAVLHYALGNLYAEQLRWGEARQAYLNASTREPDNALYVFNLAVSLDHLGLGALAAQHYQRALALDSSGSTGFNPAQTQHRLSELSAH